MGPASSLEDCSATASASAPVRKFLKVKALRIARHTPAKEALLSQSTRIVSPSARAASFSPKKAQGVSEDVDESQPQLDLGVRTRNVLHRSPKVQKRKLSKAPHVASSRGRRCPRVVQ